MNLLLDPLLSVESQAGEKLVSLPQLLEGLGTNKVQSLPGLQRHQEDAFHIFLCYLAGAVLARAAQTDPCQDAAFWLEGLRDLTGRPDDAAWTLVVEDPTLPAFMQPPVPTAAIFEGFRPKATAPDELDVLQTAKNHDVKSGRVSRGRPQDWFYALVSLQTMSGFLGQGNYGIARMNGGFAARLCCGLVYSGSAADRWRREVRRLLAEREALLAGPWGYRPDGLVLTWLAPWDGNTSLPLSTLDPFFIEVARAVRLVGDADNLRALGMPSKVPRIAAKEAKGLLGDPWTPINRKKETALTVSPAGFTPGLLRDLLFEDGFELTAMQRPEPGREGDSCAFRAAVLVRGQGTTDGFREAVVPIPATAATRLFSRGAERDRLSALSKQALNDAGVMQNRVLKAALLSFLEAGPEKIDWDRREVTAWWERAADEFTEAWSGEYFPCLWRTAHAPDEQRARREWLDTLRRRAYGVLAAAIERYPARTGRRYGARAGAEATFLRALFNHFPELKEANYDQVSNS